MIRCLMVVHYWMLFGPRRATATLESAPGSGLHRHISLHAEMPYMLLEIDIVGLIHILSFDVNGLALMDALRPSEQDFEHHEHQIDYMG